MLHVIQWLNDFSAPWRNIKLYILYILYVFIYFQPLGNSNSTIKEADRESVHSAPASNSDSGRGSNEDADSGPLHHRQQRNNSRGNIDLLVWWMLAFIKYL